MSSIHLIRLSFRADSEDWSFVGDPCMDSPNQPVDRDLSMTAGDEAAFCHSLNHVIGTKTDGEKLDMWWRETACWRKLDGKWRITHVHRSVPLDTETGTASLDLKP
jgi:ketosteroid isomerase-like protein